MSMYRQLWLAIITSTLLAVGGSLLASIVSARGYLQKRNGTGQRGFVGLRVLPRPNAYAQAIAGLDTLSR